MTHEELIARSNKTLKRGREAIALMDKVIKETKGILASTKTKG